MKRLIVNADDFGLSQGTNLGILRAHREGLVTSATLMVNMPGAPEAFQIAGHTPTLGVGLHVTLTGGRPLSAHVPSLTGPDGRFHKFDALLAQAHRVDLEREITAQVEAFLSSGLRPTHMDGHHHIHLELPAAGEVVQRLAAELGIPVRAMPDAPRFDTRFYGRERTTEGALLDMLASLEPDSTTEIMCHPAYLDPELAHGSRYAAERVQELATLTAPAVREAVVRHQIRLITYRDLP